MDVVAEAVAHRLLPCRVLMDEKPPKFSHLGDDRLHRHTCNQDMAMAPGSLHASDEVHGMDSPRHVELRPSLFFVYLSVVMRKRASRVCM